MKLLFLLFVITMAIQGSMGTAVERLKAAEEAFETAKRLVPAVVQAVANAHNDVPMKWAYRNYKHELRSLYEKVLNEATNRGPCLQKSSKLIKPVLQFKNEYNQDDAPAEVKEVARLINKHYDADLKKDVERLDQLYTSAMVEENSYTAEDRRIGDLITAFC